MLRRATTFVSLYGLTEAARNATVKVGLLIARPGYRRWASPDFSTMAAAAGSTHVSARDAVASALGVPAVDLDRFEDEFDGVWSELLRREVERALLFPSIFRIGKGGAFALYALVRSTVPTTVVETGVADGHSSFVVLRALAANEHGRLVSLDVCAGAGCLLDDEERQRWRLDLVDERAPKDALLAVLDDVGGVDLFLHDSDHRYRWQMFELQAVLPHVPPGGVIACDDVDDSFAFIDFCAATGAVPVLLVQEHKVLGIAPMGGDRVPAELRS